MEGGPIAKTDTTQSATFGKPAWKISTLMSVIVLILGGHVLWKSSIAKVAVTGVDMDRKLMVPDSAMLKTRFRVATSRHMNATVRFDTSGSHFVFLGVYQMAPTIYHSGVIVCEKSDFQDTDEDALAHMISCRSDEAIPGSDDWWTCWHSNMYSCGSHCCCEAGHSFDNNGNCVPCSSVPFLEVNRDWWSKREVPCKILQYGGSDGSSPCSGSWVEDTTFDSDYSLSSHFGNDYTWKYIYGTSDMNGQAAYDALCEGAKNCPDCLQWSGTDYSILGPNCNTYSTCCMKCAYGLSGEQPDLFWSSMVSCECA